MSPVGSGDRDDLGDSSGDASVQAVRERLLAEHGQVLDVVDACADAVADRWEGGVAADADTDADANTDADADRATDVAPTTSDRDAVVPAMREALAAADVLDRLLNLLVAAAEALDVDLAASPVAAPPYLVVTATGPVVRATLPDVGRLVVSVRVFEVARGGDAPAYRRLDATAREALSVELR